MVYWTALLFLTPKGVPGPPPGPPPGPKNVVFYKLHGLRPTTAHFLTLCIHGLRPTTAHFLTLCNAIRRAYVKIDPKNPKFRLKSDELGYGCRG